MYSKEPIMEILEAFDLTKSFRAAAVSCGVDHRSVAARVAARTAGLDLGAGVKRAGVADGFADKIVAWVQQSHGLVRADVVHDKLVAMGFEGSDRTTRRVAAAAKAQWRAAHHRIYRPWVPEPGLWLQCDYGDGPLVAAPRRCCSWPGWLGHGSGS